MDKLIKFWDPIATPYVLSDPLSAPHVQLKPGFYEPMKHETTKSNSTFREVNSIFTGESTCMTLRSVSI